MNVSTLTGITVPAALLLLLSACAANVPKPSGELAATQAAVHAAEGAGARDAAPVLLNSAQNKLSEAQDAISNEDYAKAKTLLDDAQADAELAEAKADTAKTQKAANELDKSSNSMQYP